MAAVYIPVFIAIGIIAIFSIIYFAMAGTISGFSPNAIFFGIFTVYALIGLFIYPLIAARILLRHGTILQLGTVNLKQTVTNGVSHGL